MKTHYSFLKNCIYFICATILPLLLWNKLQGVDNLYMYAHGKDMLTYGLIRNTDIFSMHDDFDFMYQKWSFCILTYEIISQFGWNGLTWATYMLMFALFVTLFFFGVRHNKVHLLFNVILIMAGAYIMEANGTLRFRPHVIAGIIMIAIIHILEEHAHDLHIKHVCLLIGLSIILMAFHSTMWIMYVICFLPYVFNINTSFEVIKKRDYSILPVGVTCILMFFAGVINPNGIKQFGYMFTCLTATGKSYAHIDELQPIPLAAYMPVLVFGLMSLSVIVFTVLKVKTKLYLPAIYMIIGSLIMPLLSWRLVFYTVIFIIIGTILQTKQCEDSSLGLDTYILPLVSCSLAFLILFTGIFVHVIRYSDTSDIAFAHGTKDIELEYALNMINDISGEGTTIMTTTGHVGSYAIYLGLKPYMDCRAEVYDININHKKDILSEIQDLSSNIYQDMALDEGGILLFDKEYQPDYYVLTIYSDADMNIKKALDKYGFELIYGVDDNTTVFVYKQTGT